MALFAQGAVPSVADLVARTRRIGSAVGAPVQALAADRVLSWTHLVMAETHARRARGTRRARADDTTIEFVLYAAADRQIGRALDAVGVRPGTDVAVCLVTLQAVDPDHLKAASAAEGFAPSEVWQAGAVRPDPATAEAAHAWWAARLQRAPHAPVREVEDALLGAMALLAVAKP